MSDGITDCENGYYDKPVTILDELKKKQFVANYYERPYLLPQKAVLVSDIEEVLSKATCENCKWFNPKKYDHSCVVECTNMKSALYQVYLLGGSDEMNAYGCNQWESKEVKE